MAGAAGARPVAVEPGDTHYRLAVCQHCEVGLGRAEIVDALRRKTRGNTESKVTVSDSVWYVKVKLSLVGMRVLFLV